MDFKYQAFTYNAKILSPIHIGTGEKINKKEFFLSSGKLNIINLQELLKSRADDLEEISQKLTQNYSLSKLLKDSPSENVFKYSLPCEYNPVEILPHIKSIYQNPYLSGSSIKGAIRTCLLYKLLQSEEWFEEGKNILNSTLKKLSEKPDYEIKKLALQIGNDIGSEIEKNIFGGKEGHNSLRALQISDTDPAKDINSLQISEVKVLSLQIQGGTGWKKFSLYPETIKGSFNLSDKSGNNSTTLKGSIKVDNYLLEENKQNNARLGYRDQKNLIQNFSRFCNKYSYNRINEEINFFKNCELPEIAGWYENLKNLKINDSQFLLQIGWGTGFNSKTVTHYIFSDYMEEIRHCFKLGKKKARFHNRCASEVLSSYNKKGYYFCPACRIDCIKPEETVIMPFPKSRKIVFLNGKPHSPLGWVLFSLEPVKHKNENRKKSEE